MGGVATMTKPELPTMTERWMTPFREIFDRDLKTWFEGFRFPVFEEIRVEEFVRDDQLVIRAEAPGVDPDRDIEITVDEGMLTVSVERREETTEETEGRKRSEFRYGSFRRMLPIPKGVDEHMVTATYTDGILEVVVPMPKEEATPVTRIPVTKT
jgi:HSP20 family protein